MKSKLVTLIPALVLGIGLLGNPGSALAGEQIYVKSLPASAYTNGVLKSFTWTELYDWSACGVLDDNYYTVYYDILNATQIHITKVKVDYYLKGPSGSGVFGGWMVADQSGPTGQRLGTLQGDWFTRYTWNSATRDSEGYSHVGTYTHVGPLTITGRKAFIEKQTTIDGYTRCSGPYDYSELQVKW